MKLILKEETFDHNKIKIKNYKNNQKIIYDMDNIYLIGIPLKLSDIRIVNQTNKYIVIDIKQSKQKSILKKIDEYFTDKYNFYYDSFIKHMVLKLKKNESINYSDGQDIYFSVNNIKKNNSFTTIQLFTI